MQMNHSLIFTTTMQRFVATLVLVAGLLSLSSCSSTDPITPSVRVRKNAKNLTAEEKADFVNAVLKLKQTKSPYDPDLNYYDQFVKWHLLAFYCVEGDNQHEMYPAHQRPSFLPWHRVYLDMFETALKQVSGADIALPYWDWTDPASTAAVFSDDLLGGDGDPSQEYAVTTGPFRKDAWIVRVTDVRFFKSIFIEEKTDPHDVQHLVRGFGKFKDSTVTLPSVAELNNTLSISKYDSAPWNSSVDTAVSFRNSLEGWRHTAGDTCNDGFMDVKWTPTKRSEMHNVVHLWTGGIIKLNGKVIGGNMTTDTSPNDPAFWLHHANIDRIWSAWMQRHGRVYEPVTGGPKGSNLNDVMMPWGMRTDGKNTPNAVLDGSVFNVEYDVLP
jgi:tyrosinase